MATYPLDFGHLRHNVDEPAKHRVVMKLMTVSVVGGSKLTLGGNHEHYEEDTLYTGGEGGEKGKGKLFRVCLNVG